MQSYGTVTFCDFTQKQCSSGCGHGVIYTNDEEVGVIYNIAITLYPHFPEQN